MIFCMLTLKYPQGSVMCHTNFQEAQYTIHRAVLLLGARDLNGLSMRQFIYFLGYCFTHRISQWINYKIKRWIHVCALSYKTKCQYCVQYTHRSY